MTALSKRKSKLVFETGDTVRGYGTVRPIGLDGKPGKPRRVVVQRPIVVEANERYFVVHLKGTRETFTGTWLGVYQRAAKDKADADRKAKAAAKKAKGGKR